MEIASSSFSSEAAVSINDQFSAREDFHDFTGYFDVLISSPVSGHVMSLLAHGPFCAGIEEHYIGI